MKFKFPILLATLGLCAFALNAPAQSPTLNPATTVATNAVIQDTGTFFDSVQGFFTTLDTNSTTFVNKRADVSMGTEWQNGGAQATLNINVGVYKSVSLESFTTGGNIGGTLTKQGLGIGYNVVIADLKITPYLAGVYNFAQNGNKARIGAEPGVVFAKALTTHTYGFIRAGIPIGHKAGGGSGTSPLFCIGTGFTF